MSIEKGRIASSQAVYLAIGFIIGTSLILPPAQVAGHDAWIAIAASLGPALLLAWLYGNLASRFPEQTLVEISDDVLGRFLGKPVAILFLWYVFHLGSITLRFFTDFWVASIMPATPPIVFMVMISAVVALAARHGLEVVARCSQVLVPIVLASVVITAILLLREMDPGNLQPLAEAPASVMFRAVWSATADPFSVVALLLLPFAYLEDPREVGGVFSKGIVLAGLAIIVAALRNTMVLGATEDITTYPSFQAARLIDIGNVLTRVEIVIASNLMTMVFLKLAVLLYVSALGTAQLVGLEDYRPLVLPLAALMVLTAVLNFESVPESLFYRDRIDQVYATLIAVGVPSFLWIVSLVRRPRQSS